MEDDEFGLDSDVLEAVDFIIAGAGQAAGSATDSRSPPAAAAAASADERFMEIHLPAAPAQRPPERSPAPPALSILVSDPKKAGEGYQAYMTYQVNTTTELPRFHSRSFSVTRRFRDFGWLHEQLSKQFPGVIVPPLPDKLVIRGAITGKYAPEFVEPRRRALEKFLSRIAAHPLLRDSDVLQAFLEAGDSTFSAAKDETTARKSGRGIMQWFGETMQTLSNSLSNAKVDKTEDDLRVDQLSAYVDALEPRMEHAHKHVAGMVKQEQAVAETLDKFGTALVDLGRAERGTLVSALTNTGHAVDRIARMVAEHTEAEALVFEEPMHEYVRLMASVKAAIAQREEKLLSYHTAQASLASAINAQAQLERQGKVDAARTAQAEAARASERVDACKSELDQVTRRLMQEMQRFHQEKLVDFQHLMLDYVQLQVKHAKQMESAWKEILPELERIDVNEMASFDAFASPGAADAAAAGSHAGSAAGSADAPSHLDI